MTHTQALCAAKDGRMICGKTTPHPGERHTSHFGAGTYTWGYEPTAEELRCTSNIADHDEDFAPVQCIRSGEHDTHHGPNGEVWL